MNELTKQERHQVYVEALEFYKKEIIGNVDCGMCWPLIHVMTKRRKSDEDVHYNVYNICDFLPEFAALRPKGKGAHDFWWPMWTMSKREGHGVEIRLNKFDQIIKETKDDTIK